MKPADEEQVAGREPLEGERAVQPVPHGARRPPTHTELRDALARAKD